MPHLCLRCYKAEFLAPKYVSSFALPSLVNRGISFQLPTSISDFSLHSVFCFPRQSSHFSVFCLLLPMQLSGTVKLRQQDSTGGPLGGWPRSEGSSACGAFIPNYAPFELININSRRMLVNKSIKVTIFPTNIHFSPRNFSH